MWLAILLFFAPQQAVPAATKPPSLIVQLVDPGRAPLPGVEVTVKPLSGKAKSKVANTDKDGYAKFWIEADKDYSVEAKLPGFKSKPLRRVHLPNPTTTSPTAHIQVQLKPSGPATTVY